MKSTITVLMILACVATAAAVGVNGLQIADTTIPQGETKTVPILLNDADGVYGAQLDIQYDEDLIEVTGVSVGDFNCVRLDRVNDYTVRVTVGTTGRAKSGGNTLVNLKITAADGVTGSTSIKMVQATVCDSERNALPCSVDNGVISVCCSDRRVGGIIC